MNYDQLPEASVVETVAKNLSERGFKPVIVANRAEALAKIQELIPAGATVMNGSSTSLSEIGFVEYLKSGDHPWNNLHAGILAENDPQKQADLRKQSVFAEYFLGSVHAVAETGELVIASASGSQLPSYIFTSPNVIWVVGTQKIVPTSDEAMKRLREHVYPLEDARMKSTGAPGSVMAKVLLYEREPAFMGRNLHIILVNEKLGF